MAHHKIFAGLTEQAWNATRGTRGGPPSTPEVYSANEVQERDELIASSIAAFHAEQAERQRARLQEAAAERARLAEEQDVITRRQEVADTLSRAIAEETLVICQGNLDSELLAAANA